MTKELGKPPVLRPVNELLTSRQALTYLKSFVASAFGAAGPQGLCYADRPLFTQDILLTWLTDLTERQQRKLAMAKAISQSAQGSASDEEVEDDDDDEEDEDDFYDDGH